MLNPRTSNPLITLFITKRTEALCVHSLANQRDVAIRKTSSKSALLLFTFHYPSRYCAIESRPRLSSVLFFLSLLSLLVLYSYLFSGSLSVFFLFPFVAWRCCYVVKVEDEITPAGLYTNVVTEQWIKLSTCGFFKLNGKRKVNVRCYIYIAAAAAS